MTVFLSWFWGQKWRFDKLFDKIFRNKYRIS